jgi:hypothetical protein
MKRKGISTTENTENAEVDAAAPVRSVVNTEDLPDGFQMTELGPLPKEWRVVRLGDLVEREILFLRVLPHSYTPAILSKTRLRMRLWTKRIRFTRAARPQKDRASIR